MPPFDEVMSKFKKGKLHSGSKSGPPVKNRKQAVAIMLHEKREAEGGKDEYLPTKKKKPGKRPSLSTQQAALENMR